MTQYSIRTVDGNRYDFVDRDGTLAKQIWSWRFNAAAILTFGLRDRTVYFNTHNIVCVTETEVDE